MGAAAPAGLGAIRVMLADLALCPGEVSTVTHTHRTSGALLTIEPASTSVEELVLEPRPGRYCDLSLQLESDGVAARAVVLPVTCDEGDALVLDAVRSRDVLSLRLPVDVTWTPSGESDIDAQRRFDAIVRGLVVERAGCSAGEADPGDASVDAALDGGVARAPDVRSTGGRVAIPDVRAFVVSRDDARRADA